MILRFFIPGEPRPTPKLVSTGRFGKARKRDNDGSIKAWTATVIDVVRREADDRLFTCKRPLALSGLFVVEQTYDEPEPIRKPDDDRYLNLVSDALQQIVYKDDCQITSHIARKVFPSHAFPKTGAHLIICDLHEYTPMNAIMKFFLDTVVKASADTTNHFQNKERETL